MEYSDKLSMEIISSTPTGISSSSCLESAISQFQKEEKSFGKSSSICLSGKNDCSTTRDSSGSQSGKTPVGDLQPNFEGKSVNTFIYEISEFSLDKGSGSGSGDWTWGSG
jgi:hypothetical protein